jgi:hypothetical protein
VAKNSIIAKISIVPVMVSFITTLRTSRSSSASRISDKSFRVSEARISPLQLFPLRSRFRNLNAMDGLMQIKVGLYVDRHSWVPKGSASDPMWTLQ